MKLDFYYYSYQCPLNHSMLQLLSAYTNRIEIQTFDIARNKDLAEELNIFFPTLIVLNDQYRYYSPLKKEFLEDVCKGVIPEEKPYLPEQGEMVVEHVVEQLTRENVCIACDCCGAKNDQLVNAKEEFFKNASGEVYGYLHITKDDQLVGGVEYLPSISIPYPVPHEEKTAYITCIYGSDPKYDYKSAPLRELENYLKQDFDRVIVVTDEEGVFPNGNREFFLKHGYVDEGIIFIDPQYCKLHLMSKVLRNIIGSGNTAQVYEWENGKVLKLFCQEYSDEAIENEYHNAMVVADLDFAKPKAHEIISCGKRRGILYDRVEGKSNKSNINA